MRLSLFSVAVTALLSSTNAFVVPRSGLVRNPTITVLPSSVDNENEQGATSFAEHIQDAGRIALTTASVWAAQASIAFADSPDWGLFEGRTGSLIHPIMMLSLLAYSSYTALLGFQWRRQRTIGDEISALKKSLPDLGGASSVAAALEEAKAASDLAKINTLTNALSIEAEITKLQNERKDLSAAAPRDKHYAQGALLAFLGTAFAIEGMYVDEHLDGVPFSFQEVHTMFFFWVHFGPQSHFLRNTTYPSHCHLVPYVIGPLNTYARAGKLFPGPHLYAGAGLVVLWALAAACVPSMQKGNDTARTIHIGANLTGMGLFAWQLVSGLPILFSVIEKTKWP
jgi:hypothetical protein